MVKSSNKQILDDLPRSDDSYWDLADINKHTLPDPQECDHEFKMITGTEVECQNCRIGFFIGPEDSVRDGHLYRGDKLVI